MTATRGRFTIGRLMVLVAAVALVTSGVAELIRDGGERVMIALGPGSPWALHLGFALLLLLWWVAAIHILVTLGQAIRAVYENRTTARGREP